MFDTVAFILHAPLRSGLPKPWYDGIRFKLGPLGRDISRVEASLPRLLWGHNGRLIANQEELERGLEKLWEATNAVAVAPRLSGWTLKRADLVWQFEGLGAERIVDALSAFRLASVSSPPMHQAGRGVTWRGAGSRFMLTCYCKTRKMRVTGDVLRIEVRLVGHELVRLHGADWQDFSELWRAYREIVSRLPDVPLSEKGKAGWPEAVAQFVPREKHELLLSVVGLKERQLRTVRQRISVAAANLPQPLRWKSLLLADGPPQAVCVEPRKKRPPGNVTAVWNQGGDNSARRGAGREGGVGGASNSEQATASASEIAGLGASAAGAEEQARPLSLDATDAMLARPTCAEKRRDADGCARPKAGSPQASGSTPINPLQP